MELNDMDAYRGGKQTHADDVACLGYSVYVLNFSSYIVGQ